MTFIWHNGDFKSNDTPIITANDRLRFGEGVFRTLLVIDGKMQFAADHLSALQDAAIVFWPAYTLPAHQDLITAAHDLLIKNNCASGQAMVNIFVTGGVAAHGFATQPNPATEIFIRAQSWTTPTAPVNAIIVDTIRRNEHSPLTMLKYSGSYADQIIALREATDKGGNEAIFLNTAGNICCGSVSTLIMVKDGILITPPLSDGPQIGTTRARFIVEHNVTQRSITPAELATSDGIYLLNSLRGAVPVTSLNGTEIPLAPPLNKDPHIEC